MFKVSDGSLRSSLSAGPLGEQDAIRETGTCASGGGYSSKKDAVHSTIAKLTRESDGNYMRKATEMR